MDFSNKTVIITGSGSGIGQATALAFGKRGAKVVINSRSTDSGATTLAGLRNMGTACIHVPSDVSRSDDARRLVEQTLDAFGRVDILVNNAGIVTPGRIDTVSEEDWDRTFAVNVKSAYLVSRHAIGAMRQAGGGAIVNVSSIAAERGFADRAALSASKGAVLALTRAMAKDHLADAIRVNCACPGPTRTAALDARIAGTPDPLAAMRSLTSQIPQGRLGTPAEIAAAILFAASDEAA